MKQNIIRYTVKPERAAENEAYVRKVFDALAEEHPAALRYTTLELEDRVSFVHIVEYESEDENSLKRLPAFQEFLAGIKDRCVEPPVSKSFTTIGSYRVFGG
jgi:quinol monooxygenase YgiN